MNTLSRLFPIALCTLLIACGKQEPGADTAAAEADTATAAPTETAEASEPVAATPEPAAEPSEPAATEASPEPTEEQRERAKKQAQLDYSIMEDRYLNDPRAQWASGATASSIRGSFADAKRMQGVVDGDSWSTDNQTLGFDSAELSFDKAVAATEVRVVLPDGYHAQAITQVDVRDPDGVWQKVWSGISEDKKDERGPRTWFVRQFEKTTYPTNAVKITFANNLYNDFKEIDAVQLVGD